MNVSRLISRCRVFALAGTPLLLAIRCAASEPPAPQVGAEQRELSSEEVKDSYEIYSSLLRTEVPREWKIAEWAIRQQTQTFPNLGGFHDVRQCLNFPPDQAAVYLPLIDDYVSKNNRKRTLDRNFDLPLYTLVDGGRTFASPSSTTTVSVTFEVSAVGFNKDRTRALVYVGHHCGSLCGGGGYHLLVRKDGKWQVDREFRGMSCLWAS